MRANSSKPFMGSATVSGSNRISLGVKLFLALLLVALIAISASALITNVMARQRVGTYFGRIQALSPEELRAKLYVMPETFGAGAPPPELGHSINEAFLWGGLIAVVLALLMSFYFSRRIARPITALTVATHGTAAGDYSHRVEAKGGREIEELAFAFNTLTANLERAEQLRKNMVADIAHELRTPLTTISGYLEAIEDGVVKPDTAVIGSMREEAALLALLIDDLRQLAEADAGRLELSFMPVAAEEALESAAARFSQELEAKNLTLTVDAPDEALHAHADPTRLMQVLSNLVKNAIAHTPDGGAIKMTAIAWQEDVLFSVSDSGSGIEPEDLPFVFERFYRADRSRGRATGGAGLGLTIARSLIEAQRGRIWAESVEGQGATIYFTLPAAGQEESLPQVEHLSEGWDGPSTTNEHENHETEVPYE